MQINTDRRSRKRLATRLAISNAATRLFMERGFDAVTIDEIAAAADVGRVTVFNHFQRKEDLFFDRDDEARERVLEALRECDDAVAPIECLRLLGHQLIAEGVPFLEFTERSRRFIDVIAASETLKARARAIRDELAWIVSSALAERTGRGEGDTLTRFAASLQLATWTMAFIEAHRVFRGSHDTAAAERLFLELIDRGSKGIDEALAGTDLVRPRVVER